MNFGGGYDGGFQNVGGGGFMTEDSPNVDSSQSKRKQFISHTLLPVTAAMLYKAEYNKIDESFKFANIQLHQVKFVGIIREVQESVTNLLYKIDDMTADSVIVRRWIENDENQIQARRRSECREDTYVKVFGHLKVFQEKRCIVAFSVEPIIDFNEITYHMINVVHSFLVNTKGFSSYSSANTSAAIMNAQGGATEFNGTRGTMEAFGGGQASGMSTHQQQVLDAIMSCPDDQGVSVHELKSKLRGMNDSQVRNALEFLSNEGHIYSTIDEDHYRSTAM